MLGAQLGLQEEGRANGQTQVEVGKGEMRGGGENGNPGKNSGYWVPLPPTHPSLSLLFVWCAHNVLHINGLTLTHAHTLAHTHTRTLSFTCVHSPILLEAHTRQAPSVSDCLSHSLFAHTLALSLKYTPSATVT